jgi:hypothetical protein
MPMAYLLRIYSSTKRCVVDVTTNINLSLYTPCRHKISGGISPVIPNLGNKRPAASTGSFTHEERALLYFE